MSYKLWTCKVIDKHIEWLKEQIIKYEDLLDERYRKLDSDEKLLFGLQTGYIEKK